MKESEIGKMQDIASAFDKFSQYPSRNPPAAHEEVAKVCLVMARAQYEENCSQSNDFYSINPDMATWVGQMIGTYIDDAREMLWKVFEDPATDNTDKKRIYTALVLDQQIPGAKDRVEIATQRALRLEIAKVPGTTNKKIII